MSRVVATSVAAKKAPLITRCRKECLMLFTVASENASSRRIKVVIPYIGLAYGLSQVVVPVLVHVWLTENVWPT